MPRIIELPRLIVLEVVHNARRLCRGTCRTEDAIYLAAGGFLTLMLTSMALFEIATRAVTIHAPGGAVSLILPCCWLIPASIGIHRTKAWTREWESKRGWWRKGQNANRNQPPEDDLPPSPPPHRPIAPARQRELEEA